MSPFDPFNSETWTGLLYELAERMLDLEAAGGGYLVINVIRADDPFVQFVLRPGGYVEAEATATLACPDGSRRRLTDPVALTSLRRLGWRSPLHHPLVVAEPGQRPNFWRDWPADGRPTAPMFAELAVRTLVEVFGVGHPSELALRGTLLPSGWIPERC